MNIKPNSHYDVLIVGGGIVGAGAFRECVYHGLETLMIDKQDFCDRTSANSSKMLHGGIRYLENLDFGLVFEALAPHLNHNQEFYLPLYKDSIRRPLEIQVGISLYDFLAQNPLRSPKWANKETVSRAITGLKRDGLKGAGVYMDALMDDRKLGLEIIFEAMKERNGHAINHISYQSCERINSKKVSVTLKDEITQEEHQVTCEHLLFAAGPFIDQILGKSENIHWKDIILPSKGSHLYIRNHMNLENALVMTPKDGRVIFVIPREKDRILVGTTEVQAPHDFDFLDITEEETDYLIKNFNEYFPNFPINHSHIIGSYAGVRPLVKSGGSNLGKTARTHEVYQINNNIHAIAGGKYTTFRIMAKDLVRPMFQQMGICYQQQHSTRPLEKLSTYYASENLSLSEDLIQNVIKNECVRNYQDLKNRIGISDFWNFETEEFKAKYKTIS
jgi:glycerol-3-phosphate dehydrogenase